MPALTGTKIGKPPPSTPIGTATIRTPDGRETKVEILLNPQWEQALNKLFSLINANL